MHLYRVRPARDGFLTAAAARETALVEAHFQYLADLTRRGVVLLAGRTLNNDASTFGIVILDATSEAEAAAIMRGDPAVSGGVFAADLFPFHAALVSPHILDPTGQRLASRQDDGTLST